MRKCERENMLRKCVLFIYLFIATTCDGFDFNWWGPRWRPLEENTCPFEDPNTHQCFQMLTQNRTCTSLVVHTCTESEVTENGSQSSVCYSLESASCMMYTCAPRGCCHGYVEDSSGNCVVGNIDADENCNNGGQWFPGNRTCVCPEHFTGSRCQTPICPEICQNGGRCKLDTDGVPRCVCPSQAFMGSTCQTVMCPSVCLNGGECVADGVVAVCRCPSGYAGKVCEVQVDQSQCPPSSPALQRSTGCEGQGHCLTTSDCAHDQVCCWNALCGDCTKPVNQTCIHGNSFLSPGEILHPDDCTVCVCQAWGEVVCDVMKCPDVKCMGGHSLISVEGQCCGRCPEDMDLVEDEFKAPVMENCPTTFWVADVGSNDDMATLTNLNLTATDFSGSPLKVTMTQTVFQHSHKANISYNIHVISVFSAPDRLGRRAECHVKVIVRDRFPPVFTSCPAEIFVTANEKVTWKNPVAKDNVGIYIVTAQGDEVKDSTLTPGTYPVTYTVWDFDQNEAICAFLIRVFDQDSTKLPVQLSARLDRNVTSIAVAVTGSIIAALSMAFIAVLCYKQFYRRRASRRNHTMNEGENAIYAICGPPQHTYENVLDMPKYSPPLNPPSYDEVCLRYVNTQKLRNDRKAPKFSRGEKDSTMLVSSKREPFYQNVVPSILGDEHGRSNPGYVDTSLSHSNTVPKVIALKDSSSSHEKVVNDTKEAVAKVTESHQIRPLSSPQDSCNTDTDHTYTSSTIPKVILAQGHNTSRKDNGSMKLSTTENEPVYYNTLSPSRPEKHKHHNPADESHLNSNTIPKELEENTRC